MIQQPVHLILRFLFIGLLLVLVVALGTEVAALYRKPRPAAGSMPPVLVRKSSVVPMPRKSVHAVGHRAG